MQKFKVKGELIWKINWKQTDGRTEPIPLPPVLAIAVVSVKQPQGVSSRDAGKAISAQVMDEYPPTEAASDTKRRHFVYFRSSGLGDFWAEFVLNSVKLSVEAAAMANVGGANVLANLKQRMQTIRDELDRCKDSYDDKCRELEAERELRNEVGISA